MSKINIDELAEKVAKKAIKEYDKERKQEQKKKVLFNTRLLLAHYNDLKGHLDKAIDDINKLKEHDLITSDFIDMSKEYDELYILSIKRSKIKTLIMVSHIDLAMETLKKKQKEQSSYEKYQALEKYYLKEKSYESIAEDLNCGVITARRWVNEMVNELGILLFGIDGLKLDMIS